MPARVRRCCWTCTAAGNLKLDELITRRYRLDQLNDAIKDLREGRNIRGIIEFN
jgi:S-(hydroxymethyl)glutathione dehydrogenase/alcohol dehydrogenase